MNNLIASKEDIEEVMQRENRFPIDFEASGPFGVLTHTSIAKIKKKTEGAIVPNESLTEASNIAQVTPRICDITDEQLERWLSKIGDMPRNALLLNNIGKTYLSKGNVETALKYFGEALTLGKDLRQVRANVAKAYVLQGKVNDALDVYLEDEEKYPDDINILMSIANLYFRKGDFEKAREKLDNILTFDPKNSTAYHNRGVVKLLSNKINEAINDFRKAISLDIRSTQSYNALGACYVLRNAYKKGIKNFLISLNIEKTNIHILKNLAATYQLNGQFKEAADLMEKHLLSYPMDSQARDIASFSYLNLKEYNRCVVHLSYQIQNNDELKLSDTDMARVLNNMGVVESYFKKFEQAIAIYKSSIQRCDKSHVHITYSNLVKAYLALGRIEAANYILDEYSRKGLENNSPFIILARYYYEHEDYIKSRDLLIGILEKENDNIPAMQILSSIYSEAIENIDESLDLAKRAYDLRPSDRTLANNLAYAYVRKGLVSEAKNILEKRKWDKNYFFATATKGLVKLTEGYISEGIQLYNEAEKMAWNTEWKRLVRQKKYVELARYYLNKGKLKEAQHELSRTLSTKSKINVYKQQAEKLLESLRLQQLI